MKKIAIGILLLLIGLHASTLQAQELSAFADLLVWQASEQSGATWATIISSGSTTGARTVNIGEANIKFKYDKGFRSGISYAPLSGDWESKLFWTHFSTTTSNNIRNGRQILTPEFWSGFISGNFFFGASIDWKILLNTIDWDIGYKWKPVQSFSFRPAIGIKGASIKQTASSTWDAVIYTATEKVNNDFYGVGPSFGIDTNWDLYKTKNSLFGLIGNFSTALMWGNWNIKDVYKRPAATLVTPTTITTKDTDMKLGTAMFDFLLGLQWTYESKFLFTFRVGYEMQFWANQLRMPTFQELPVHGDLTLQGGTCGIIIQL